MTRASRNSSKKWNESSFPAGVHRDLRISVISRSYTIKPNQRKSIQETKHTGCEQKHGHEDNQQILAIVLEVDVVLYRKNKDPDNTHNYKHASSYKGEKIPRGMLTRNFQIRRDEKCNDRLYLVTGPFCPNSVPSQGLLPSVVCKRGGEGEKSLTSYTAVSCCASNSSFSTIGLSHDVESFSVEYIIRFSILESGMSSKAACSAVCSTRKSFACLVFMRVCNGLADGLLHRPPKFMLR